MSDISYNLIRSARKSISIEVTRTGEVIVRAPQRLSRAKIDEFVTSKEDLILARLAAVKSLPEVKILTEEEKNELRREAERVLPEKCSFYAEKMGISFRKLSYRFQKTRWGSCSGNDNISFNCLLMLLPSPLIDYVVVHELSHIVQHNHSRQFWAVVENVMPDYKERRRLLKENSGSIIARLGK